MKIAFVPLARSTFDLHLAQEVTTAAYDQLAAAGFELLRPAQLVSDLAGVQAFIDSLEKSAGIDLLLIFQATFADSTLATALAEGISAPVFLWAVPEPRSGGRLRLNSLCGINLAGHALTLRGLEYEYAYAAPGDAATLAKIRVLAAAGQVVRRLQTARLGVIGVHPAGMDSCHLDEQQLQDRLGLQVQSIPIEGFFNQVRAIPSQQVEDVRRLMDNHLDNLAELDQAPLAGTLRVYSAMRHVTQGEGLAGLAVRCWPEFFTDLGCAACGAMSMMSDGLGEHQPIPCSCEADANGTVTQIILHWLAGEPSFGTDIVAMDFEEDVIALWHCGLAPLSMANPRYQPHGGIHSNRKVPLVMDFPLKPGTVTIARLHRTGEDLRLVLGRGEMLDAPAPFSGTAGSLRLEKPARQFFDLLMRSGLEHHISLVYGDYVAEMEALAKLLRLPVLYL